QEWGGHTFQAGPGVRGARRHPAGGAGLRASDRLHRASALLRGDGSGAAAKTRNQFISRKRCYRGKLVSDRSRTNDRVAAQIRRGTTMIQVDPLSKDFGQVMAVNDISFQVGKGEIVGFLGRNGAGKSTTIRILTTYLPATSGVARVAGYDVMTQSMEVRQHIGYLPESVPLYPEMRVEEYLDYRARLKGVERDVRLSRIEEAMDRCRIREVRRRLICTLSLGYP